ncbi:hypothetical protein [Fluviicola taffensis]|uniref:hypothetical protein n=1 Tax=Fluviicola taffensis TaxID=191579 RepID=UPI0002E7F453|nr:hypothetical protein [Fluviicola taffensis]
MSEITHSIYKTEFMKGLFSYDQYQHEKDLKRFMHYYNLERFPCKHFGLNVTEVLNGEIPNKHRFKDQIQKARIARIEKNKVFNQCPMVCI